MTSKDRRAQRARSSNSHYKLNGQSLNQVFVRPSFYWASTELQCSVRCWRIAAIETQGLHPKDYGRVSEAPCSDPGFSQAGDHRRGLVLECFHPSTLLLLLNPTLVTPFTETNHSWQLGEVTSAGGVSCVESSPTAPHEFLITSGTKVSSQFVYYQCIHYQKFYLFTLPFYQWITLRFMNRYHSHQTHVGTMPINIIYSTSLCPPLPLLYLS